MNKYKIKDLAPYSTCEISVAGGHFAFSFDDGTISLFTTSEEGECDQV